MPENHYLFLGYAYEFMFRLLYISNQEPKLDYRSRKYIKPKIIYSCRRRKIMTIITIIISNNTVLIIQ